MRAIVVRKPGGPEVLRVENIAEPKAPQAGQVLIRQKAIGVNYMDVYYRSGVYKSPRLPFIPGMEAAGVIEAVGEGVTKFEVGQRVAYATAMSGAYAEKRLVREQILTGIPDGVDDKTAVAILAKGLTAHYLLFRTYRVKRGDFILIHAAAGGVGQVMCQWAKDCGAKVIGTVSSQQKADIVRKIGCDYPIIYTQQDFVQEVKRITDGEGVPVVYDSVGKDTFRKSLDALRPLGLMVSYGQSSGAIAPVQMAELAQKSLFLTRPSLHFYKGNQLELILTAAEIYATMVKGVIKPVIGQTYKLEDAAKAHADLEARKTQGSSVLIV